MHAGGKAVVVSGYLAGAEIIISRYPGNSDWIQTPQKRYLCEKRQA